MRNLKKFLALVLAAVTIMSLTVSASAVTTGFEDDDEILSTFQDDIAVLDGMGVFEGKGDGVFDPKATITRGEMAAVIYRLMTGDVECRNEKLYVSGSTFTDVEYDSWYAGYVGFCANMGVVVGYGNGKFGPNDPVRGYEAMTMLLRAMGYNHKDQNFCGGNWELNSASMATSRHLLDKVAKTSYGSTYSEPAAREMVAEMVFQAINQPVVVYTEGFGYQTTGMLGGVFSNEQNPTLGWSNFGLTSDTGIVVGNQETGEMYTLIGLSVDENNNPNGGYSYAYKSVDQSNFTRAFDMETGLDLYGHLVTVWYDARSAARTVSSEQKNNEAWDNADFYGLTTDIKGVYAIKDNASLAVTVFADNIEDWETVNGQTTLYTSCSDANFNVKGQAGIQSYAYARMEGIGDDGIIQSPVGMYTVISNNYNRTPDLIISLNKEVAQITQVNTSTEAASQYMYIGMGGSQFGSVMTGDAKGMILLDRVLAGSDTNLGDVVTLTQVVGTIGTREDLEAEPDKYLYKTEKLDTVVKGTLASYSVGTEDIHDTAMGNVASAEYMVTAVVTSDGTMYGMSGITCSQFDYDFDEGQDSHLIDRAVTAMTSANTYAGIEYTFYLDEVGRVIGMNEPNDYGFIYATFADYETGPVGTGAIRYVINGVDWNGNLTGLKTVSGFNQTDNRSFVTMDGDQYNALGLTRRDQGMVSSTGNQVAYGVNSGFMLDGSGHLTTGVLHNQPASINGKAVVNNEYDDPTVWRITSADAKAGYARVVNGDGKSYLLTENTVFHVVSGNGTGNLTVTTFDGISKLVGDTTCAVITKAAFEEGLYGNENGVYFQTTSDRTGKLSVGGDSTIETVILSVGNLSYEDIDMLFFSAPGNTWTNVVLSGTDPDVDYIHQYLLWNNGTSGLYYIKDTGNGDPAVDGTAVGEDGVGTFYMLQLVETHNGIPVYSAVPAPLGNSMTGGQYTRLSVNGQTTAEIVDEDGNGVIYDVSGAVVVEVPGTNDDSSDPMGVYVPHSKINTVAGLNFAAAMEDVVNSREMYDISVAITFDPTNRAVTNIYVTNYTYCQHGQQSAPIPTPPTVNPPEPEPTETEIVAPVQPEVTEPDIDDIYDI